MKTILLLIASAVCVSGEVGAGRGYLPSIVQWRENCIGKEVIFITNGSPARVSSPSFIKLDMQYITNTAITITHIKDEPTVTKTENGWTVEIKQNNQQ